MLKATECELKREWVDNVYENGRGWMSIINVGPLRSATESQKLILGWVYASAVVGTMTDLESNKGQITTHVMWVWLYQLVCV